MNKLLSKNEIQSSIGVLEGAIRMHQYAIKKIREIAKDQSRHTQDVANFDIRKLTAHILYYNYLVNFYRTHKTSPTSKQKDILIKKAKSLHHIPYDVNIAVTEIRWQKLY